VILVVFPGVQTLDLTGPAEVFAAANHYDVVVASAAGEPVTTSSGLLIATRDLHRIRATSRDTVLVTGGDEVAIFNALTDDALLRWLTHAARSAARIGSVCSGAFLLAGIGVLDGRRAATHWSACDRLAAFRPSVCVDRDAIFVREGRVWSSAGVTTGIDMALAMVEEDHDRALADGIAARLVLYARRPGFQSQFSDALVAQATSSSPLARVIEWARTHVAELDPQVLAKRAGMSERTFHRRCLEVLSTTPAKLVEKLRVEHARTLIASTDLSAKSLAAACGFGSPVRMKRAFERSLGVSPRDYRLLFASRLLRSRK
jgi:transcriptional regulator GlxA family with amidase domain